MTSLSSYSCYRPGTVPWLGNVPAHWSITRAKWLFQKMDRPIREQDEVVTCFRDGVVTLRKNRRELGFTESLKEIGYQGIRRGDLVVHSMDSFAGAIGVSDSDGKGSPVYSVCKPQSHVDAYFYAHILREMARNQWIQALAKGIRERSSDFRYTELALQRVPVPPPPEQAAIVCYLDRIDERICRYISTKKRLIRLLEQEKQAVIDRAVTRGLEPNVRLKPSSVRWLANMPSHWEVQRLKTLAHIRYGLGQPPRESATGLPLIRATNVERGRIIDKGLIHVDPSDVPNGRDALLRAQEIVVVRSGAYTADSAIIPRSFEGAVAGYDMVVTVTNSIPQFVAIAFLSKYLRDDQLIVLSTRSAQPHLNAEELGSALMLVPPIAEQSAIVEYVRKTIIDIDSAISRTRRQIKLIQEYRTRLISDVVTGKLDVRGTEVGLSDEADTLKPLREVGEITGGHRI